MKKNILLIIIIGLSVFLGGCEKFFFYPDNVLRYHPDLCAAGPSDVIFFSSDNTRLHGWYFKTEQAVPKGVVFFLHGNAQNISFSIHSVLWLLEEGYDIFTFDYRGYGISGGKPEIKGIIQDSLAALDFLVEDTYITGRKIIIYGQSLGGAVAIDTAALTSHQDKIRAVITDSTFSSWRLVYREGAANFWLTWPFQYPISAFIDDSYAPVKYIDKIPEEIPVLIIHNRQDRVVDSSHSDRLKQASGGRAEVWLTELPGHVTVLGDKDYRARFLEFINN